MTDPRQITASIVGAVDWQTEVSGFCRCPGEALHTHQNGKKDCRVSVDGAPTIYCFHASCALAVAEANRALRRELGARSWELGDCIAEWKGFAEWGHFTARRNSADQGGH